MLACAAILVGGLEGHAVREFSSASQSRVKLLNDWRNLLFLHYLDVSPPDGSGRFMHSECLLRQLQIVCRKRHKMFGHARLGTLLCEPYAPFGQLSVVFGSQHSRMMTAAAGSLNLNRGKRFKFD